MSILDAKGKFSTPGIPCIYQIANGMVLFSESAHEDDDSYIFDGDETLVVMVQAQGNGQSQLTMAKAGAAGFKPKQMRVFKHAVEFVQDTSDPALLAKFHEALSGLVLPK